MPVDPAKPADPATGGHEVRRQTLNSRQLLFPPLALAHSAR